MTWKSIIIVLCLLVPSVSLAQEPNQRRHRHTRKVTRIVTAAAPAYVANAVDFDGTNDFLLRGGDLTGNANSKFGIISVWARIDGGDGADGRVVRGTGNDHRLTKQASNKWQYDAENLAGTDIILLRSTNTFTASSAWIHVLAAWDLNTPEGHLFIDGVNVEDTGVSIETDDEVNYQTSDHAVGASGSGSSKFNGCFAELYYNTAEFLDITVAANRDKFRDSATSKPVSLGIDGSLPTGTAPILYLNGDATNFQTNQGTGGNFTVTGALVDCSTSPTD